MPTGWPACDADGVRLESPGGAVVDLRIVDGTRSELVVEGVVDTPDGRSWRFRDACLTRAEAAALGGWLLRAAKGRLEPPDRLAFAVPALAFTLDEHDEGRPRITVGFSLAAAPSWLGEERQRTFDYPVTLELTADSLEAAAVAWERELAAY